jgi:hypothetical protein
MSETNGDIRNQNGTFAKGNPGKPKGAVIKISVKVREHIVNFLEANIETIQADFETLKARERLQFIAEILPYAAPKLSAIQTDINAEHSGGITVRWENPNSGRSESSIGIVQSLPSGLPDNS